jgi:hypothetical protein
MITTSHNMELKIIVPQWCLQHTTHYEIKSSVFSWCLLILEFHILFNLFIKNYMFVTFTIGNSEGCSTINFDNNGHIHELEEDWLLMLVGHPRHPPPLGPHLNINTNGFVYPMPKPTWPCCVMHQQLPLVSIARILQ